MKIKQSFIPKVERSRFLAVLDRMIAGDLFKTTSAILLVLVVIIVSQKFIKVLAQAIEGNIANDTVFLLLALKTIIVTSSFLPAAVFMSVLIVVGRMYQDQEIAAIASAGGGVFTIYRGVFLFILPLSFFAAGLSIFAAPWAEAKSQLLMHSDQQNADIRGISAGSFREYSNGELIFYAEKVDANGRMHKIFVQNKQGSKIGVVNAEYGRLENLNGGLYLIMENGERLLGVIGEKDFTFESFKEYAVQIETKTTAISFNNQAEPINQLLSSSALKDIAEIQNRLAVPESLLLLGFMAVPLARISPRNGVFASLLVAFGIYFTYGNLLRLSYSWVANAVIPSWLGFLGLNALLLLIGIVLLMRNYGWAWLFHSLFGNRSL